MEVFRGDAATLVRLRCCARRGMYLATDEDRVSVRLRRGRHAADDILWSARRAAGADGEDAVLLRGCYGLFLATSHRPAGIGPLDAVEAQQRALEDGSAPPPSMLWQAVRSSSSDSDTFLIRNCGGRFLRANGRYLRWKKDVTVALDPKSSMMKWHVEVIPVEEQQLSSVLGLGHPQRKELLQSIQASIREEKSLLQSILAEIEAEECKRSISEMKMKCAQEKERALMAEEKRSKEKRGNISLKTLWAAKHAQIACKAYDSHCITVEKSQVKIHELKSLKVDKEQRIMQLKWQRSHLKK